MKIKSAKEFRLWYKTSEKQHSKDDKTYDENFVGCYHYADDGKTILHKGFFEMYHGDKKEMKDFLRVTLKMAEDSQAIFEFLQNAEDCNSTHFYAFYNEQYLLILNNGDPFKVEGLKSLLNLAQSDKKDASLIGRLGVGFKLVHRLVGKNDGVDEMIDNYFGPVMASWSKHSDLEELRNNPTIEISDEFDNTSDLPFLLKIIATNFLANPGEKVRDINYQLFTPFPLSEVKELSDFLDACLQSIETDGVLNHGSLFFIKLGEGKYNLLKEVSGDIISGIQYSMNTMTHLSHVYINNDQVEKVELKKEEGKVVKDSIEFKAIDPDYNENDIKFSVGYNIIADYNDDKSYIHVDELKKCPSFYKYFPMGDERHGLALFVHSDSFSIQTNRRKLNEDQANKNLLPEIAKFLCNRLDEYKDKDRESFLQLYANLLLSEMPKDNSPWLREVFYNYFKDYLKNNIPVDDGFCDNPSNVKIRLTKNKIDLQELGTSQHWFEWTADRMTKAARDSSNLGLRNWNILDVFNNADEDKINSWIDSLADEDYQTLLSDIDETAVKTIPESQTEVLKKIKLFKFSDGKFYSYLEIIHRKRSQDSSYGPLYYCANKIYRTDTLSVLDDQLESFGLSMSLSNLSRYPNLSRIMPLPQVAEMTELMNKNNVFFSHCMGEFGEIEYGEMQQALSNVFGLKIPSYLFAKKTSAWRALFENDCKIGDCRLYNGNEASVNDVFSLIFFSRKNNEKFFEHFVIIGENDGICFIGTKGDLFQQYYAKGRLAGVVNEHTNYLYLLPKVFCVDDIPNEEGIISEEEVESLLINSRDFDEIKVELASVISAKNRKIFLEKIDLLRVNLDRPITKDSYEYRVMEMACKYYVKREDKRAIGDFQDKIQIVYEGIKYDVTLELIGQRDSFELGGTHFSMSAIVPGSDKNAGLVDLMIDKFVEAGLDRQELSILININEDVDVEDLFNKLRDNYALLRNAQQLAFILKCNQVYCYSLERFKVRTLDNNVYGLNDKYFYFNNASFLPDDCILSWDYKGLNKYIDLPVGHILSGPFVVEGRILCKGLSLDDWNDEKAEELLTVLYDLWCEKPEDVKRANISFIDDCPVESCLKVDPRKIVVPNTYARKDETIPKYMEEWIQDYEDGMKFLIDLGLQGADSPTVELRKYLRGDIPNLNRDKYIQCNFAQLYFSIEWFCEQGLMALDEKMFGLIKEISERLESYSWKPQRREPIEDRYDIELMKKNSVEWNEDRYKAWKKTTNIRVWMYDGPMPKVVTIGKKCYPFYRYQEGNYYDAGYNIFINKKSNPESVLQFISLTGGSVLTPSLFNLLNKSSDILLRSKLNDAETKLKAAENRIKELEETIAKLEEEVRKLRGE